MNQPSDHQHGKEARDRRYGQALAGLLRSDPPEGPCLTADEIDTLVTGKVAGSTRERLLAHLGDCDSCLRSFGVAAELRREEQEAARRKLWLRLPVAVAAVLLLAVSLFLAPAGTVPEDSPARQGPICSERSLCGSSRCRSGRIACFTPCSSRNDKTSGNLSWRVPRSLSPLRVRHIKHPLLLYRAPPRLSRHQWASAPLWLFWRLSPST